MTQDLQSQSRVRGCLLGGAVGDALGAPIEFQDRAEIARQFGAGGIRDFVPAYGVVGAITDDTQMALFTAEGLVRAHVWPRAGDNPVVEVHYSYLRWLRTQGEEAEDFTGVFAMDGWLLDLQSLWARRAPGNTCLSALRDGVEPGAPARNGSKGCGTVMRAAPIGLVMPAERAFPLSVDMAALTHGHPTAQLSAGFLSAMVSELVQGAKLPDAMAVARSMLVACPKHEETLAAVDRATALAATGRADADTLEKLGAGWIAEEALAIALYSVLATTSLEQAVLLAVNHSGDSDSTGAIAGNIAGALYGVEAVPARWLAPLELRDEIVSMADDLFAVQHDTLDRSDRVTVARYPQRETREERAERFCYSDPGQVVWDLSNCTGEPFEFGETGAEKLRQRVRGNGDEGS